jgi:hypothetical protein
MQRCQRGPAHTAPVQRSDLAEGDRAAGIALTIQIVAKRKPASTVSRERSDRQPSAGASRPTAPRLASSTDADSPLSGEVGVATEMLLTKAEQVSDDGACAARLRLHRPRRRGCRFGARWAARRRLPRRGSGACSCRRFG